MNRSTRPILVVDDDAKIAQLVRVYLEREGYRVVAAHDGNAALAALALDEPALVILDLMLPQVDGMAILRAIRRRDRTPVLILSARGAAQDRIAGLLEGADDYVTKPFSPAELVLRVQRLLRPPHPGTADRPARGTITRGSLTVDIERQEALLHGVPLSLTRVELALLAVLLEGDGRVLTREHLLDAIHGTDDGDVLDRSIDAHVRRLRAKLGDDPARPTYIATVRGVGYRAAGVGATP
ncbi:MAG: response regulator transcription factor [Chloroflexota bacterium]